LNSSNQRDKFLILWSPIDEKLTTNDLSEFWKTISTKKLQVNEHKVKCIIKCEGIEECDNIKMMPSSVSTPNFSSNSQSGIHDSNLNNSNINSDSSNHLPSDNKNFRRKLHSRMTLHSIQDSTTTLIPSLSSDNENNNNNNNNNKFHSNINQTNPNINEQMYSLELNVISFYIQFCIISMLI
jgi:hypothetical protein